MRVWVIVALALSSLLGSLVFGAAASLGVGSADVGAGDSLVSSCDDAVTVSFGPVVWEPSIPGYKITTVTLSGIDQPACANAELRLQLTGAEGAALGVEKVIGDIDSATAVTFFFTGENIKAEDVTDVHVALVGP